jgi:hypothetical protein
MVSIFIIGIFSSIIVIYLATMQSDKINSNTTKDDTVSDRRLFKRIPFRTRVKYGLFDPNFSGHTLNISEDGFAVESRHVLPPKSRIVVNLHTGSRVIVLDGVIVWVSPTLSRFPSTMGIKFLHTLTI